MTIPQKVKIGALAYQVYKTDKLALGNNYTGEILYDDLTINLRPTAPAKMEADFLHECVHAIFEDLGYRGHDEKKVDELAHALHAFIINNPQIFIAEEEAEHADQSDSEPSQGDT